MAEANQPYLYKGFPAMLARSALVEALRNEGLRRSRNQVGALLKAKGTKISELTRADLNREAKLWVDDHRQQVMGAVLGDLLWTRVAKLLTSVPKQNEPKSTASVVQMSGSK
jgi:hypothetical protein